MVGILITKCFEGKLRLIWKYYPEFSSRDRRKERKSSKRVVCNLLEIPTQYHPSTAERYLYTNLLYNGRKWIMVLYVFNEMNCSSSDIRQYWCDSAVFVCNRFLHVDSYLCACFSCSDNATE